MKKKLLATLLTVSLFATLAGCGQESVEPMVSVGSASSVTVPTNTPSSVQTVSVEENEAEAYVNTVPETYDYYFEVSINPHITFYINDNKITNWVFNNEDARDAFGDIDFLGKYPNQAVNDVIDTCIEKKYLKEDGTVKISYTKGECEVPNGSIVEVEDTVKSIVDRDIIKRVFFEVEKRDSENNEFEVVDKGECDQAETKATDNDIDKKVVDADKKNADTNKKTDDGKNEAPGKESNEVKDTAPEKSDSANTTNVPSDPSKDDTPSAPSKEKETEKPAAHTHSSEGKQLEGRMTKNPSNSCEFISEVWYICDCGEKVITKTESSFFHNEVHDSSEVVSTEIVVENGIVVEVTNLKVTGWHCADCGFAGECEEFYTTYNNTGKTYDEYMGISTPEPEPEPAPEPEPTPEPTPAVPET